MNQSTGDVDAYAPWLLLPSVTVPTPALRKKNGENVTAPSAGTTDVRPMTAKLPLVRLAILCGPSPRNVPKSERRRSTLNSVPAAETRDSNVKITRTTVSAFRMLLPLPPTSPALNMNEQAVSSVSTPAPSVTSSIAVPERENRPQG